MRLKGRPNIRRKNEILKYLKVIEDDLIKHAVYKLNIIKVCIFGIVG